MALNDSVERPETMGIEAEGGQEGQGAGGMDGPINLALGNA